MRKMKRIKGLALACAIGLGSFSFINVTSASAAEKTNATSKGIAVCYAKYANTKARTDKSTSSKLAYSVAKGTRFNGVWVSGETVDGTNQWLKFYDPNWKTDLYVSKSVCN
ncbi:lysin [Bacillus cereus]|uniref:lysin n=1 Tax=Bacillus cereus TaxID=1396 RepID=UPI000B4AE0A7|nr:lysin [Bacillus cereus]